MNSIFCRRLYAIVFLLGFGLVNLISARELQYQCPEEFDTPKITWSGYIDTEGWFDTRQIVGTNDNLEVLYPERKKYDLNGCDINDHPQFGIVPFNVRLAARIDGPALFCSNETFASFQADFTGLEETVVPVLFFRHGYIKFDWGSTALLIGQYEHPIYIDDCYPNTVSFNAGAPIAAYALAPQVRSIWRPNWSSDSPDAVKDELQLTVLSQTNPYLSVGPLDYSSTYIQNGVMPAIDFQWRKSLDQATVLGVGVDFKRLVPRLSTTSMDFKDSKGIISTTAFAYLCHRTPNFALRNKVLYVHDGAELGFTGGYAVDCEDAITKKRSYTNLRLLTYWLDTELYPESSFSPGIFLGVSRNFGADKKLFRDPDTNQLILYAGGADIRILGRVAPRIWAKCGPITFGAEVEWTYAEYGTPNDFGEANTDPEPVGVVRFLGVMYYNF